MPKFIVGRNYGYVGTEGTKEVECDTLDEAEDIAWEFAIEKLDSWAEPVEEEDDT